MAWPIASSDCCYPYCSTPILGQFLHTQFVRLIEFDDDDVGGMDRNCLFSVIGLGLFCTFNEDTTLVCIDTDDWASEWLSLSLATMALATV